MKKIQFLSLVFSLFLVNISYASLDNTSTPLQTQTAIIGGKKYTIILATQSTLWIKNAQNKVIYRLNQKDDPTLGFEDFDEFEITDFDADGLVDILVTTLTNAGDTYTMITYDKPSHAFHAIKNLSDYPNAEKLANTPYYYSYHKSGCADEDWDSDLFYIKDFHAIKIATISGRGCNSHETKNSINIYNTKNGKDQLIEQLPLDRIEDYPDNKWGFIKDYWTKNYTKFHP